MSWQAQAWVWTLDGLTPLAKLVALALANYAGPDGERIHPGDQRVAAETGVSVKTVRRARDALVEAGHLILVATGGRGAGRNNANVYQMPVDMQRVADFYRPKNPPAGEVFQEPSMPENPPRRSEKPPKAKVENPPTGTEKPPSQTTQPTPNLKDEPVEEPSARVRARGVRQEDASLVDKAIDIWNRTCGNKLPKAVAANGARARRIRDRILDGGGDLDRFESVCRMVAESDFLTGSRGFTASIDWMINPANWQKIVEGNYRNRREPPRQSHFMDNLEAMGYVPEAKRGPVNTIDGELAR